MQAPFRRGVEHKMQNIQLWKFTSVQKVSSAPGRAGILYGEIHWPPPCCTTRLRIPFGLIVPYPVKLKFRWREILGLCWHCSLRASSRWVSPPAGWEIGCTQSVLYLHIISTCPLGNSIFLRSWFRQVGQSQVNKREIYWYSSIRRWRLGISQRSRIITRLPATPNRTFSVSFSLYCFVSPRVRYAQESYASEF